MEKRSKFLYVLSIISIVLLVLSIIVFSYSALNVKNINNLKKDNNKLNDELKSNLKKEKDIEEKYISKSKELKTAEEDFANKYGYSYKDKEDFILKSNLDSLIATNKSLLDQIKIEISKYSDYYSGVYYKTEAFDNALNDFYKLSDLKSTESLSTDLYKNSNIANFIGNAKDTGTIGYLSTLNSDTRENNVLLFSTAIYSIKLNEALSDKKDIEGSLNEIYSEVINLYNLYSSLEQRGFNTGNLSSNRLLVFKNDISNLIRQYYENQGVIESLQNLKEGDNNEKTK